MRVSSSTLAVLVSILVASTMSFGCGGRDRGRGGGGGGDGGTTGGLTCSSACGRLSTTCMISDPACEMNCTSASADDRNVFFGCIAMATCSEMIDCLSMAGGGGTCTCDTDFDCTAGCGCDPECSGGEDAGTGGGADDGIAGDPCTCDAIPTAPAEEGVVCSGTSDGCMGYGLSGELACLAQAMSGYGACVYRCSPSEVGTQGSCPDGYYCNDAPFVDATGTPWPICTR